MFSIEIYKLNRNGTERTRGKAGVGDGGRAPRPADALLVVRWAGRCGERTERCQWQRKRSERVAAVKILSVRRKAAQKFWAPQQDHRPLRRFDKETPAWNPLLARGPRGRRMRIATGALRPRNDRFFARGASGRYFSSLGRTKFRNTAMRVAMTTGDLPKMVVTASGNWARAAEA